MKKYVLYTFVALFHVLNKMCVLFFIIYLPPTTPSGIFYQFSGGCLRYCVQILLLFFPLLNSTHIHTHLHIHTHICLLLNFAHETIKIDCCLMFRKMKFILQTKKQTTKKSFISLYKL